jgi:hypothetical protein
MKTIKTLSAEADAVLAGNPGREAFEIRADLESAMASEFPAVVAAAATARERGCGKKAVVAAAVAAILDLEEPGVIEALCMVIVAESWKKVNWPLSRLGFAGQLIAWPQARGLRLPCSAHACPGSWGTNWGLPNVRAVAEMLVERAPAQPTSGDGWALTSD